MAKQDKCRGGCFLCKRWASLDENFWWDQKINYLIAGKRIVFMVCLGKGYMVGIDVRGAQIMVSGTIRYTREQEKEIAETDYYDVQMQLFHGHSPVRLIRSGKTCQSVWFYIFKRTSSFRNMEVQVTENSL